MSVSGGLHKAIDAAVALKMDTVQIFTSSPSQWAAKPLDRPAIEAWHHTWKASGLVHPIAHASYLINLAGIDELFQKSVDALVDQWQRCEALHLNGLVVHPGAFTKTSEPEGIQKVAEGVIEAFQRVVPKHCRLLLENTAGQGTCLGHQISQLGSMIDRAIDQAPTLKKHIGVCIDTCHAFAAGYEIHKEEGLAAFCKELKTLLPRGSVKALHLNDSKKPLGSRVDRHEHIGHGAIGLEAFGRILNDSMFAKIPGYLETEKGRIDDSGLEWDAINMLALRNLSGKLA